MDYVHVPDFEEQNPKTVEVQNIPISFNTVQLKNGQAVDMNDGRVLVEKHGERDLIQVFDRLGSYELNIKGQTPKQAGNTIGNYIIDVLGDDDMVNALQFLNKSNKIYIKQSFLELEVYKNLSKEQSLTEEQNDFMFSVKEMMDSMSDFLTDDTAHQIKPQNTLGIKIDNLEVLKESYKEKRKLANSKDDVNESIQDTVQNNKGAYRRFLKVNSIMNDISSDLKKFSKAFMNVRGKDTVKNVNRLCSRYDLLNKELKSFYKIVREKEGTVSIDSISRAGMTEAYRSLKRSINYLRNESIIVIGDIDKDKKISEKIGTKDNNPDDKLYKRILKKAKELDDGNGFLREHLDLKLISAIESRGNVFTPIVIRPITVGNFNSDTNTVSVQFNVPENGGYVKGIGMEIPFTGEIKNKEDRMFFERKMQHVMEYYSPAVQAKVKNNNENYGMDTVNINHTLTTIVSQATKDMEADREKVGKEFGMRKERLEKSQKKLSELNRQQVKYFGLNRYIDRYINNGQREKQIMALRSTIAGERRSLEAFKGKTFEELCRMVMPVEEGLSPQKPEIKTEVKQIEMDNKEITKKRGNMR